MTKSSHDTRLTGRQVAWLDAHAGCGWTGGVYFLRCSATGLVKIGCTGSFRTRFAALQATSAARLELIGTVPGGFDVEAEWHQKYSEKRVHHEWFALDAADVESLARASTAHRFAAEASAAGPLSDYLAAILTDPDIDDRVAMETVAHALDAAHRDAPDPLAPSRRAIVHAWTEGANGR